MQNAQQARTYTRCESVVFLKTGDPFGGLSNMAPNYPIRIAGITIRTSEALYQACRFPHMPELQRLIIEQASPMTAKMKSKPYRQRSRSDWDRVRVVIMRWCLRVKLAQNWQSFGGLLEATGERPIVEESRKDDFWGAKPVDPEVLIGFNALGRLLMELRTDLRKDLHGWTHIAPLPIADFSFNGRPIEPVLIERQRKEESRPSMEGMVQDQLFVEVLAGKKGERG